MSYTVPEPCSWTPKGTSLCGAPDPVIHADIVVPSTKGPTSWNHSINTNYALNVGGHVIPCIKTVRNFEV